KLQHACQSTLQNNPSSIANQEYLDIVTVLNSLGAIVALLVGAYLSVKLSALQPFFIGLAVSLVLLYTVWLTLNPALITTYVQPSSSAGIDAIAILILTNKIYLRANKVFFGLFPAIGSIHPAVELLVAIIRRALRNLDGRHGGPHWFHLRHHGFARAVDVLLVVHH
ncbi:MAG: hypothetical protein RL707_1839, partial [Pseudomonadota bacterium]